MKMPGLNGQDLYMSLAERPHHYRERFLFVTGDAIAAQTREFLERNKIPCLTKPFLLEELTAKIRQLLADHLQKSQAPNTLQTKAARK
jgi:DNA-binding response OmpR family regulator